jgi:hypothetical protein
MRLHVLEKVVKIRKKISVVTSPEDQLTLIAVGIQTLGILPRALYSQPLHHIITCDYLYDDIYLHTDV